MQVRKWKGMFRGFCLAFLISSLMCQAELVYNTGNPEDPNSINSISEENSQLFGLNSSEFNILIYEGHGEEPRIEQAMRILKIPYDLRTPDNPVTLDDLHNYDILIVGWNRNGNTNGLDPNVLAEGIIGSIILSGHDLDYHTVAGIEAARIFFKQAIEYVLAGSSTGLILLGDTAGFQYLPTEWGITVSQLDGQTVKTFTDEGLASGIFDNLTPDMLCNWFASYHDYFTAWGDDFVPFEKGGSTGQEVITIARQNPYGIVLAKKDNIDPNTFPCAGLGETVVYTLTYSYPDDPNHTKQPISDITLVDYLPAGATYMSSDPPAVYNQQERTLTWAIDTIEPNTVGDVNCIVYVNNLSEPGGFLYNRAILRDSGGDLSISIRRTPICCWDSGRVIYVKYDADGLNTGTSWVNAYRDLQDAIARKNRCGGQKEIWVARGTYSPGPLVTDTFTIPAGCSVYGGFEGWETDPNQRNIKANPSILTGNTSVYDGAVL